MADESERRHRINATNPSRLEMALSLEPGAPASLEEAASRVTRGEPVVEPADAAPRPQVESQQPPGQPG